MTGKCLGLQLPAPRKAMNALPYRLREDIACTGKNPAFVPVAHKFAARYRC